MTDKALVNNSMLLATAQPRICELAEGLLGSDWTTYGSALVFKRQGGGGPAIELHRDVLVSEIALHPDHRFFNADLYLDAASAETGCLKVLPGSHQLSDVRHLIEQGLACPGLVDVVMNPGDLLLHNSLLLHGSLATGAESPLRRVLYYSYQSAEWMLKEGVLPGLLPSRSWIAANIKLMAHAATLRTQAAHLADKGQYDYRVPTEWEDDVNSAALELRPISGNLPWEGI